MTLTLELKEGIYYLKENGKTIVTLYYGPSGLKVKRLNVVINSELWGGTKRVDKFHIFIGLDEEEA